MTFSIHPAISTISPMYRFITTSLLAMMALALTSALCPAQDNPTSMKEFKFELLPVDGHGETTVTQEGPSGFVLNLKNTAAHNYGIAMANFDFTATAQHKLTFRITGAPQNANASMTVVLLYEDDAGKWHGRDAQLGRFSSSDPRTIVLALNRDFQFGDASYRFRQLKFSIGGTPQDNPDTRITVTGVRLVTADEISTGAGTDFVVYPPEKRPAPAGGVRVFFDFDNDDDKDFLQSNQNNHFPDIVSPFGYAQLLLEHAEGLLCRAASPADAEVIVYSRAAAGGSAAAIAEAVRQRQVPLLIFGAVPDQEVSALSPLALSARKYTAMPERASVDGKSLPVYFDAKLLRGRVLLDSGTGNPLIAQDGAVTHYAFGIGNQLGSRSDVFHDRGLLEQLLRAAGRDTAPLAEREAAVIARRQAADAALIASALADAGEDGGALPWRVGASKDNVGRFGWAVGEGLPFGAISKDLTISSGSAVARFVVGQADEWPLRKWHLEAVSGAVKLPEGADENTRWEGEGVVEYTTDFSFPEAEDADAQFYFEVREGIDDTDEVTFNGRRIGATDERTPFYWIAPRRYPIPAELIRRDGANRLVVRVTNLRDGAGFRSRPVISMSRRTASEIHVAHADWIGKTYQVREHDSPYEMQFSLLSPMVRYDFQAQSQAGLSLENLADYVAWRTAGGWKITPLDGSAAAIYRRGGDDGMAAPYLLCFRKNAGRPFLIVLQRHPEAITASFRDGLVERIEFSARPGAAVGQILAGWPWGAVDVDTSAWRDGIPAEVSEKIDRDAARALAWPEGCDELFAIDRARGRVEILNRFRFRQIENDWQMAARRYATLPPLVGEMLKAGKLAECQAPIEDLQCSTTLGGTYGIPGSAIRYSLPLPDGKEFYPVRVKDDLLYPAGNEHFTVGVQYSAGGATPFEQWTPAAPYGGSLPFGSICLFRWQFGLAPVLQELPMLNDANRIAAFNRLRTRHLEPLELYQYKSVAKYRVEPYSQLWYPVVFNAVFPNGVNFAPGTASCGNYGDANEGYALCVWIGSMLGDLCGQREFVRSNWNFYRAVMRYATVLEDYAYMASTCRETGIGAWIDMLDAEFASMIAYARLAKLSGDDETADLALYHAAKRAIPTVARLFYADYARKVLPESAVGQFQVNGFSEDGINLDRYPSTNFNFRAANELFNCSQGTPGALLQLYRRHCAAEVTEHVDQRSWPSLTGHGTAYWSFTYLTPFALFLSDAGRVGKYARGTIANQPLEWRDWPRMTYMFELGNVAWRLNGQVNLSRVWELELQHAEYLPQRRQLVIRCQAAGPDAELVFESPRPPATAVRNGVPVEAVAVPGLGYRLPLAAGSNEFTVSFQP